MKWRDLTLTTTQTIGNRQKKTKKKTIEYNTTNTQYENDNNDMKQ